MFAKTAEFYDLVYSFKDYEAEAAKIRDLIHAKHPSAKAILDVACGTGEHARFLAANFSIDGIDLQPEFVEAAQRKVSGGEFTTGDMRNFELKKKYDVVQCLFSSIGYLTSGEDVISALRSFRSHLKPGGIVVVEPWFTPDVYQAGGLHMAPPIDQPDLKIVRMNVSEIDGNLSRLRFNYLVGRKEGIELIKEDHCLALYSVAEMLSFFDQANLKAEYDPEGIFGRGLYVARDAI
ncbi:MAG: class I SAM-dependent methyltransferase [Pseudomonadota bacterium]